MAHKVRFRLALTLCILGMLGILLSMINALQAEAATSGEDVPPIIRLHVIPNSDAPADQDLKITVRNDMVLQLAGIVDYTAGMSLDEAYARIEQSLPDLKENVAGRLSAEGIEQDVNLHLGVRAYDDRLYLGTIVPAGDYISLEVVLGDGRGRNFWCIIFPSMCFVPDEVQVLGEERSRTNIAEAAEPGRTVATRPQSTTFQFRWRFWERIDHINDETEGDMTQIAAKQSSEAEVE